MKLILVALLFLAGAFAFYQYQTAQQLQASLNQANAKVAELQSQMDALTKKAAAPVAVPSTYKSPLDTPR